MRTQNDPDEDQHEYKRDSGPDVIAFIPNIVPDCASDRSSQILPKVVLWLRFGRALEEKYNQPGKYSHRNPVKDGFQRIPPLQI